MPGYISEISYQGGQPQDFIEIVVPTGTVVSAYKVVVYAQSGAEFATISLGSIESTIAGKDVYVADNNDTGFLPISAGQGFALVDNLGNVVQFVSVQGNPITATAGPATGQTSTDIGTAPANGTSLQSTDGGSSYQVVTANPGTIPCYAPGTMIETPGAAQAVEMLGVGDMVTTVDHGAQPIRWVRSGEVPLEQAGLDEKPVLIARNALGQKRPVKDMVVSPQHRILVGCAGQLLPLFNDAVFVPAKSLTSLPGIRHMAGKKKIMWHHFAFDRHEVVIANGCQSESLLLGPMVVNKLTRSERQDVSDIFGAAPTPDAALNEPPARPCLKVGEVCKLLGKRSQPRRAALQLEGDRVEVLARQRAKAALVGPVPKPLSAKTRRVAFMIKPLAIPH